VRAPRFPSATLDALWAEVSAARPDAVAVLINRLRSGECDAPSAVLVDGLCAVAGHVLREGNPARLSLTPGQAEDLAAYFDMAPLARASHPRLSEWLGRIDDQGSSALELLFMDAATVREDGLPRLLDLFMGRLPEAEQVLGLAAVAVEGGRESYICISELG